MLEFPYYKQLQVIRRGLLTLSTHLCGNSNSSRLNYALKPKTPFGKIYFNVYAITKKTIALAYESITAKTDIFPTIFDYYSLATRANCR